MDCPFCAYPATRNFEHQKVYWFCNHCWQEVPEFERTLSLPRLSSLVRQDNLLEQLQSRMTQKRHVYLVPNG